MPDLVDVSKKIEHIILKLKEEGHRSEELIRNKADAVRTHEKGLGVETARLKSEGTPATLIDRLARDRCADLHHAVIIAEESLKAHYVRIQILQSQLNGYQSIFRHLSHTD